MSGQKPDIKQQYQEALATSPEAATRFLIAYAQTLVRGDFTNFQELVLATRRSLELAAHNLTGQPRLNEIRGTANIILKSLENDPNGSFKLDMLGMTDPVAAASKIIRLTTSIVTSQENTSLLDEKGNNRLGSAFTVAVSAIPREADQEIIPAAIIAASEALRLEQPRLAA